MDILYQDPHLIAVNKRPDELSVPGKPPLHRHSTWQQVQQLFPSALVVHRLDFATSGILLFALNRSSQKQLQHQFQARQIGKTYRALVDGRLKAASGTIDYPLNKDWPRRPRQCLDFVGGKAALTHWQRGQVYENFSEIMLMPITGRSHQLRLHTQLIGHPILGDRLYHPHPQTSTQSRQLTPRLYLHASAVRCQHPIYGTPWQVHCKAPFPH